MKAIDEQIIAKPLSPVVQNWTREVVTLALSLLYWKVELLLSRTRGPIMFAPIFALNVNEKKITWSGLELPSINLCASSEMVVGWKKNDPLLQQKIFTQKIISNNSVSGWWWLARCEAGCLLFPESQFSTENLRLRLRCRDSQDWRHSLSCLRDKARPRNKNRPVNYNPSLKQMDKKASI